MASVMPEEVANSKSLGALNSHFHEILFGFLQGV